MKSEMDDITDMLNVDCMNTTVVDANEQLG